MKIAQFQALVENALNDPKPLLDFVKPVNPTQVEQAGQILAEIRSQIETENKLKQQAKALKVNRLMNIHEEREFHFKQEFGAFVNALADLAVKLSDRVIIPAHKGRLA